MPSAPVWQSNTCRARFTRLIGPGRVELEKRARAGLAGPAAPPTELAANGFLSRNFFCLNHFCLLSGERIFFLGWERVRVGARVGLGLCCTEKAVAAKVGPGFCCPGRDAAATANTAKVRRMAGGTTLHCLAPGTEVAGWLAAAAHCSAPPARPGTITELKIASTPHYKFTRTTRDSSSTS